MWLMRVAKTGNFSSLWMVIRPGFFYHKNREEKIWKRKTWHENSKGKLVAVALTNTLQR